MIDNQVVSRIAQKIRSTRLEKNLTIQQLANPYAREQRIAFKN